MCLFNGMTKRVSGEYQSLVSVIINDVDVTKDPHPVVEARLRTSLKVNVSWDMWYNPVGQYGWMQVSLYNNATWLHNSTQYTENGYNNNRVWDCSLVSDEWTLANNKEYGRVAVTLLRYDGIEIESNTTWYTIRVLPEQVNLSLPSYTFKNDSNGRMDHLNASYFVTSSQDPSFHHPGLGFSCEIFDGANVLLQMADFYVNPLGYLDVVIEREYLVFVEGQTMKIKNHATTLIEPITIETDMGAIVNRTDFLLYYRNLTEAYEGGNASVIVNLEAGTSINRTGVIGLPLYFEWIVSNGTGPPLQSGSSSAPLGTVMSVFLDPRFTPIIEQLTVDLWFEGNFVFKSKQVSLQLRDQVLREEIDICFMNQALLIAEGIGDLCFHLKGMQSGIPVSYHLVRIVVLNETSGESTSSMVCTTDGNGSTTISLMDGAIRDLEHVHVLVQAFANLVLKESIRTFHMGDIFTRMRPTLRLNNATMGLTLDSSSENMISMSVLADGDVGFFSGRLAKLVFFDEKHVAILECYTPVGQDGLIACILPVHIMRAGQTIRVSVKIDATLKSQELSSIVQFHVVAIIDSAGTATMLAWTSTVFILAAIFGVLITLWCVKKARYKFLSKDQFTITIA
jgi:hypothetical protein